jgi:DNA invertase Pin-like site-specific DNA recombinase
MLAMTTTPSGRYAAGYIRESTEDPERDAEAQKAGQREDVIRVARSDGTDPASILWFDDWGRSGSEHAKRPQQERLLSEVRAGKVAVIYARALDRLMRSTRRLADLLDLAEKTGTRIVTQREGEVRQDNPSTWIFVNAIMMAAEYESRVGRIRAKAAMATKVREGQRIGRYEYGEDPSRPEQDLDAVLAAFDEAGSYNGASRLLNERKVPTRNGGDTLWSGTVVGKIVRRHRRDIAIQPKRQGAAPRTARLFAGLLRCEWCETHGNPGRYMTSMPRRVGWNGNKTETIAYFCSTGRMIDGHPRPLVIAESKVKPWVAKTLEPFKTIAASRMAKTTPEAAEVVQGQRDALKAEGARVLDLYQAGDLDKDEYTRRRDDVRARLEALERRGFLLHVFDTPGALQPVPLIDLGGDPATANAELRQLWTAILMRHRDGVMVPHDVLWQPGAKEWAEGRDPEEVGA